jgi:hypothetical protein
VRQGIPTALRSLGPQIGTHPDDLNRQAAEAAIDSFAQQSDSLQNVRQGTFSLADSLRASAFLEQQAQALKTTCIAADGSYDINLLDRIHLQKLRQAITTKDKDLTKSGALASIVPDIIDDISCKLETHALTHKFQPLATSVTMRMLCIRGAWVDIPLNGLFSDVSDTASSVDRYMDGVTNTHSKPLVHHSIDNITTYTRWLENMRDLNATFEPMARIKPGWDSIVGLVNHGAKSKWTFVEVRRLAHAALTDHKRAMKAWATSRNTLTEPPKVGEQGFLVMDVLLSIKQLAANREVDTSDPIHNGSSRPAYSFPIPQASSTSAHTAALLNHQMAQQAAHQSTAHHSQPAHHPRSQRGSQRIHQGQPLPPPPPVLPVNQPIFTNIVPAIPLDPAQQLLPSHLWCRSMVIPAFNCQRTMCSSLCRYNHTLPAWRKDGQLLNDALRSMGIAPPS